MIFMIYTSILDDLAKKIKSRMQAGSLKEIKFSLITFLFELGYRGALHPISLSIVNIFALYTLKKITKKRCYKKFCGFSKFN